MFYWYEESMVCYVYLSDMPGDCPYLNDDLLSNDKRWDSTFRKSTWFNRAWTLQELIAPRRLIFHSSSWSRICNLRDVVDSVRSRTRIDVSVLLHQTSLGAVPVAKRMSWAANREATRVEDIAYSLLGIFDVNMPMLYGERSRAFIRLQEHIIRACTDQTVFTSDTFSHLRSDVAKLPPPLLARSPKGFLHGRATSLWRSSNSFELTNAGLRLRTQLLHLHDDHYAAILDSRSDNGSVPEAYVHALKLVKRQSTSGGGGLPETYHIVDRHCKACVSENCVYSMSFLPARLIDVDKETAEQAESKDIIVAYGDHREIDRHNLKRKDVVQVTLNNLSLHEARPEHAWQLSTRRKPEMQIPESFLVPRTTGIERDFLKYDSDFIRGYLRVSPHGGGSMYLVVTALKHIDDAVSFDAGFVEDRHTAELSDAHRPHEDLVTAKEWHVPGRTYRVSQDNSYKDGNTVSFTVSSSEAHDQRMNEPDRVLADSKALVVRARTV